MVVITRSSTGLRRQQPNYQNFPPLTLFLKLVNEMHSRLLLGQKNLIWLWTGGDHFSQSILAWVLGDRSSQPFENVWALITVWQWYFWVTDGDCVYTMSINLGNQIISKTYLIRVEGENTRLSHYRARLHRKTVWHLQSEQMLRYSIRLLIHYRKYKSIPSFS